MQDETAPRVIKRYANRKLYDMSESCYITHDEIASLVERGEELRIIDNRTKEDLTSATLAQILFDKERRIRKTIPLDTLRNLFQQSNDFIQRHITQPVTSLRDEAEKNVRKVFRGRTAEHDHEELDSEPDEAEVVARAKPTETLREAYENLQKSVEERWSVLTKYVGQFDVNHRRIVELERRLELLEARVAELEEPLDDR